MPIKQTYFSTTINATATESGIINLGRTWDRVALEVPTTPSASDFFIQASVSSGGTFRRVTQRIPNTVSVQGFDFKISSLVTNRIVPIPNNFQFLKVEASTANTSTLAFNVICRD